MHVIVPLVGRKTGNVIDRQPSYNVLVLRVPGLEEGVMFVIDGWNIHLDAGHAPGARRARAGQTYPLDSRSSEQGIVMTWRRSWLNFMAGTVCGLLLASLWRPPAATPSVAPVHRSQLAPATHAHPPTPTGWQPPSGAVPLFVPYTFGYSMLLQTLSQYAFVEWPHVVVIDNSRDHHVYQRARLLRERYNVAAVLPTTAPLHFSQLMHTLVYYARLWKAEWYYWTHSDAFLLPDAAPPARDAAGAAWRCVRDAARRNPNVSVVFFGYDHLSATRTAAAAAVPWDTALLHYLADCDQYGRQRMAGLPQAECSVGAVFNDPPLLDPNTLRQLRRGDVAFEDKVKLMTATVAGQPIQSYAWRDRDALGPQGEAARQAAKALRFRGYEHYFAQKWDVPPGQDKACEVPGQRRPVFDVAPLPPFPWDPGEHGGKEGAAQAP